MSINFNGTTQDMALPDDMTSLQNVSGISFTAWINLSATPIATNSLAGFSIDNSGTPSQNSRFALGIVTATSFLGFGVKAPDSLVTAVGLTTLSAIPNNTWTHIAVSVDIANDTSSIYINGVLDTSGTTSFTPTATNNSVSTSCRLAGRDNGGAEFFDGLMHDVRVYSRDLSAAEVQAIYTCQGHDSINDYVNRWIMDAGGFGATAGTEFDLGNNRADGTPTNAPTYADGPFAMRKRYG